MPLQIIREDITRMEVDAIVTAGSAQPGTPTPSGGVNGSIHRKAGPSLLGELRSKGGIRTGEPTLTEAYNLPCRYVIHTAGPVWRGGSYGEETLLRACYREALQLAAERGFESIAFPLISTGKYSYPKAEAMQVATQTIRAFLAEHDMTVYLVVYDRESYVLSDKLFRDVQQFIDQHYVDQHTARRQASIDETRAADNMPLCSCLLYEPVQESAAAEKHSSDSTEDGLPAELVRQLHRLDEGFSGLLLRLIDERGMKDAECYRRANVDRKLFSKIRNNPGYTPRKPTVAAFCVALKLNLPQARELLSRAGYSLNHASIFDVILEYFITRGMYDVDIINQALWHYDQPLLGSEKGA